MSLLGTNNEGTATTLNTQNLIVEDPLIKLANNNPADLLDTGFYAHYNNGTDRYSGVFRDTTTGIFNFFKNLTVEPTSTVDVSDPSYQLADISVRSITESVDSLFTHNVNINSINSAKVRVNVNNNPNGSESGIDWWGSANIYGTYFAESGAGNSMDNEQQ